MNFDHDLNSDYPDEKGDGSKQASFPVADRRLIVALWFGLFAGLLLFAVWQAVTGSDPFTAWNGCVRGGLAILSRYRCASSYPELWVPRGDQRTAATSVHASSRLNGSPA